MKLGKIFICINILVLSLLMHGEIFIKILVTDLTNTIHCRNGELQNSYNTPSQFKNRNSKTKMVFEIFMAWENEFVKIFTLFPEIHAPVLSHFTTLKYYS